MCYWNYLCLFFCVVDMLINLCDVIVLCVFCFFSRLREIISKVYTSRSTRFSLNFFLVCFLVFVCVLFCLEMFCYICMVFVVFVCCVCWWWLSFRSCRLSLRFGIVRVFLCLLCFWVVWIVCVFMFVWCLCLCCCMFLFVCWWVCFDCLWVLGVCLMF